MSISKELIQKVKDASNIVDVVSDFYELRRRGTGYVCLCPFPGHDDKHLGSFRIYPRGNYCHCFSCGGHANSIDFLMMHEKLSLEDAVRWLAAKYSIDVDGVERFKVRKCAPHKKAEPLPMLTLDFLQMVRPTLIGDNILIRWLRALPWTGAQRHRLELSLKQYAVGTSNEGHVIWWQIDHLLRVRTGKMMKYKPDGHRDKDAYHSFDWIHSLLARDDVYNPDEYEKVTCLFGLHLLCARPSTTVNLVESEKTALICNAYFEPNESVWMATGGMSNFNRSALAPLIDSGTYIIVYPDKDGAEKWQAAAKEIGYDRIYVNTQFMRDNWRAEDGEKADIADILIRHLLTVKQPSLWDHMKQQHPQLQELERIGIEVIQNG